jgi:uncharacterized protein YjbJ (UPF0337 family)
LSRAKIPAKKSAHALQDAAHPTSSGEHIVKTLPWIVAGVGLGFAAYIVLNTPPPQYSTGSDDIEDAADKTSLWGSKQRIAGAGRSIAGRVKEGIGRATGDDELAGEGVADQVVGVAKDTAGSAAHAVSNTIHELNR